MLTQRRFYVEKRSPSRTNSCRAIQRSRSCTALLPGLYDATALVDRIRLDAAGHDLVSYVQRQRIEPGDPLEISSDRETHFPRWIGRMYEDLVSRSHCEVSFKCESDGS